MKSIMPSTRWYHLAVLALATATGCANLEARKVPLADRLNSTDDKYKGFRYYLSRPYLVVSRRVCLGQQIVAGKLMQNKANEYFIETVNDAGGPRYVDLHGGDRTREVAADDSLVYVTYPAPPPDASSGGGAGKTPTAAVGKGGGAAGIVVTPPTPPQGTPEQKKDVDITATPLTPAQVKQMIADASAPAGSPKADDTTPSAFQFVMLPDFEEQMAVKDRNFAAKGKYELKFADGWQLRSVGGSWDATEVAVRALQVLSDAVSATAAVRQEQLNKLPVVKKQTDLADQAARAKQVFVVRVWGTYVEPGVYRLQKASEKQAAPAAPEAAPECPVAGILSDLGLPTVTDAQTYLLAP
jgi:hypothetical protein